ncbi:MAG: LysR family transcriptional regulator, partial [Limosilactobacillus sp.]
MDNFDLKTLQIFEVVCKLQSFSRAANALYLDQSTVSKKMRQLERAVNQRLFDRTSAGVALTPQGRAMRPRIEKILADVRALNMPVKLRLNDLRFGLMDNIAAYHYVDFLAENIDRFKRVLISNKGIELINQFNDGQLDALVLNADLTDQITGEFHEEIVAEEPFGVLSGRSLPKTVMTLQELAQQKLLIAPAYCPVSQELRQKLPDSVQLQQLGYTNTLLELVAHSDFLSILPVQMTTRLA